MTTELMPEYRARTEPAPLRMDRIVVGLLVILVGAGWLLDSAGVDVPWRALPATGLVIVGLGLVATVLWRGAGRGALVGLGAVLLVLSVLAGIGTSRFSGGVGDRVVAPGPADWPVRTELAVGNLTVDLTQHPLPSSGRLEADLGTGTLTVVLDREAPVRIDATIAAGAVRVDGAEQRNGLDVEWSSPASAGDDVLVVLDVGAGTVEVRHE